MKKIINGIGFLLYGVAFGVLSVMALVAGGIMVGIFGGICAVTYHWILKQ